MYDTARRVALVKQRVRENTRRRQRREAISLSAACMLLCAVLTQAANTVIGQGQTAVWGVFGAMLLRQDAGGYVLVGVVSFTAAAVITALCFRLRIKGNQNQGQSESRRDGQAEPTRTGGEKPMKKRILSILLLCCMVLTMLPAPAFAADEETYALSPDTGGLCEHHPEHDETCGYTPQTEDAAGTPCGHVCEICESGAGGADPVDLAGASGDTTQKALSGEVSLTATQYTYTLHYDANGGSGAPPSQSVTSSEFYVEVPISEIIPTRDGYTFMGWANTRTGKPIYGGNGGYTECLVVHGADMSTTIYAIWEAHDHSWGEWTSNGNGTHKRTCNTDNSHTETGSCSGGKATSTEKAVCETCHTAYGELLQPAKTVITTPPTLRLPAYIGNEYTDAALMGGEAKTESTGVVVPGTFRFKYYEGGRVHPGENHMVILFTPEDTEAYTTAECIITVMGTKRTITRVPDDVIITNKPLGTAFEDLGLPSGVKVETNTGASYSPVPVTWDGSTYNPNKYGEQIITGELHVEQSPYYKDKLEPTSTVKATARITLIDDRIFTPTLEPPTYSKQLYGGDLCFLVFSDKYLSGGTATANEIGRAHV